MRRNPSRLSLAGVSLVCVLVLSACNPAPELRYVTVSPSTAAVNLNALQQFTSQVYYTDGSMRDGTGLVSWSSSNSSIATIGSDGVAHAVGIGTATISATVGAASGSATLVVNNVDSIAVTPVNPSIASAGTQQFTATGTYNSTSTTVNLTNMVTWTSGTTTVATINSSGLATAVGSGATLITATLNGVSGSTHLTVGTPVPVSLQVSPASPTLAIGNSTTFTAQELWSDSTLHAPSGTVTWVSGTTATATILANAGTALAHAAGTSTITATEGSLTGNTTLTVVTGTAKYAYVANNGAGNNIEWYAVNVASSTPFTSPSTLTMSAPYQIALHPSGKYMYELDVANSIQVLNVGTNGALTTTAITPVTAGSVGPTYMAVDPYGRFLYAVDAGTTSIYGYTISPTDGSLTLISGAPFSFPGSLSQPQQVVIDHTGSYLYVPDYADNFVSGYSIDQTTGALTALSPSTAGTGNGPQFAALDPAGTHLYVANSTDNTVTMIPIGPAGAMGTPVTTSALAGAAAVSNVVVDPAGAHLYVLDSGGATGQVYGFNLNSDGTVGTAISGTPKSTGIFPFFNMAIDPTGALLATANNIDGPPGTISLFAIGAGGTLTADTPVTAGDAPTFVIFLNTP